VTKDEIENMTRQIFKPYAPSEQVQIDEKDKSDNPETTRTESFCPNCGYQIPNE